MKKCKRIISGIILVFSSILIFFFFADPVPMPGEFDWFRLGILAAAALGLLLTVSLAIFLSNKKIAGKNDMVFSVFPIFSDDENIPIVYNRLVAMAQKKECLIRTYPIKYPYTAYIMIPQNFVKKIAITFCQKQKELSIISVYDISFYFFLKIEKDWQYFDYNCY